jgi:hypothetical protein
LSNLLSNHTTAQHKPEPPKLSLQSVTDAQNSLSRYFQDSNLDHLVNIPPEIMQLLSQMTSQAGSSQAGSSQAGSSQSVLALNSMEVDDQSQALGPQAAVLTSLQPPISAPPTSTSSISPSNSISSANKRKRATIDDIKPEPSSRRTSSKRTTSKDPTTISAFVGMTGALGGITTALNQSVTQGDIPTVQSAVAIVSKMDWLSDEDRGLLVNYYSRNPTAAAGLIGLDDNTLKISLTSCIQLIRSNVMSM